MVNRVPLPGFPVTPHPQQSIAIQAASAIAGAVLFTFSPAYLVCSCGVFYGQRQRMLAAGQFSVHEFLVFLLFVQPFFSALCLCPFAPFLTFVSFVVSSFCHSRERGNLVCSFLSFF